MVQAPAICDDCGSVFPSGYVFGGTGTAHVTGNKSGPCPDCGGVGSVPDGIYHFRDETLHIVSTWPEERRKDLADKLAAAQQAQDRQAVEHALAQESDFRDLLLQLLVPTNAGEFWALVAAIIAALVFLHA
jgi:hypothetical protein